MKLDDRLKFGKGVKLRSEPDGTRMLLIPEGALVLNDSAASTLELVDGHRTVAEIAGEVVERFDVSPEEAREEVTALLERLLERRFVEPA